MKEYLVIVRKRFNDPPEIVTRSTSASSAEDYAQSLYSSLQLDMVIVAERTPDPFVEFEHRLRKIMKIERTCKHPNIQGEMWIGDGIVYKCTGCGMVFKPDVRKVISNIEISSTPYSTKTIT